MTKDVTITYDRFTVSGTGPYALSWPYFADSTLAEIEDGGVVVPLVIDADFVVDQPIAATGGNLFLTAEAAALWAGKTLIALRQTPPEQGWMAIQGEREAGLEAQLDRLAMVAQEHGNGIQSAVRVSGRKLNPFVPQDGATIIFEGGQPVVGPTADEIANAQGYAEAAAESAEEAAVSAAEAEANRIITQEAAAIATDMVNAALASTNLFATIAAGLAATTSGEYFATITDDPNVYARLYLNESGTATLVREVMSRVYIDTGDLVLQTLLNVLAAKLGLISVTAPTDLDFIRARVQGLTSAVVLRGEWNPISGIFPGGGAGQSGDSYIVSGFGATVDGVVFAVGDRITALVNNASTSTYAGNWLKEDYTDRVTSVAGRIGNVVLTAADIAETGLLKILTLEERNKLARLTVTNPTDLDALRVRVAQLDAALINMGTWAPASGAFPAGAQRSEYWRVSAAGTFGGVAFEVGDWLISAIDNASTTTFAGQWYRNTNFNREAYDALLAGLDTALVDKGNWNPIGGVFPGSGTSQRGALWKVSGFGATVDGIAFEVGDWIVATVDNASTTTYAGNWEKREAFRRTDPEFYGTVTMAGWSFSYDARGMFLNSDDDLTFWGVDIEQGLVHVGASVWDMSIQDRFVIGYQGGHAIAQADFSTGAFWIGADEFRPSDFVGLRIASADADFTGAFSFQVDQTTGYSEGVFGPRRLSIGLFDDEAPGGFQPGAVMDHTRSGEYGQYWVEDGQGTRRFIYRDYLGAFSPHVLDTPMMTILEIAAQSWGQRRDVTADLDYEDPTGATRARLEAYINREVVVPKPAEPFAGMFPWDPDDYPYVAGYSVPYIPMDGLRGIRPGGIGESFNIAEIAAYQYAELMRAWGMQRDAICLVRTGRSGTHEHFFIPEGTSYTWSTGSYAADAISGEYIWANDIAMRAEVEAIIRDQFKKRPVYGPLMFIQGLADGTPQNNDDGEMRAYMDLWSAQQNLLGLRTASGALRPIFVPIRAPDTNQDFLTYGPMDQIEWGIDNAGGNFYIKGPRYHLPYEDQIHQSAYSALREGEELGVAMAYWARYGTYAPLRTTNIASSAHSLVLTTNGPAQASGVLVADTVKTPATANMGITVRDNTGVPLTVSAAFTGDTEITVSVTEDMTSFPSIEFGLGARGTIRADGTPAVPVHSGCVTNIKMAGVEVGVFTQEPVDQWILPHLKILTVV